MGEPSGAKRPRKMSEEGRLAISEAVRRWWARVRGLLPE